MPKRAQIESLNLTLKFFHSKKTRWKKIFIPSIGTQVPIKTRPSSYLVYLGLQCTPLPKWMRAVNITTDHVGDCMALLLESSIAAAVNQSLGYHPLPNP